LLIKRHAEDMKNFFMLAASLGAIVLTGCSRSPKLIIGLDASYPPFEFKDKDGTFQGVSVDLGKAFAKHLGREAEFRNIGFDGLMAALKSGSIDCVISSMTATDERRKSIDFSDPYVKTRLALLVSKNSPVQSFDDLKSPERRVVVRLGTSGESFAKQALPDTPRVALDNDTSCVMEVVKGSADAWIYDLLSVTRYHERHPDATRALPKPVREEAWAIGLKQGDEALKKQANEFLTKFRADGGFKSLAEKYLADDQKLMRSQGLPFVFDL
jgi:ABC-type amino acid transport substrate-binding protein